MKLVSIFFTAIESIFVFCCLASNKQIREKYKVYLKFSKMRRFCQFCTKSLCIIPDFY